MRTLALGLLSLALVACATPGSSASPAVSMAEAEATALRNTDSLIPAHVVSAKFSTYGLEAPNRYAAPGTTAVWAVRIAGSFDLACGTPTISLQSHSCTPGATTELVLIDAQTGAFIEGLSPP